MHFCYIDESGGFEAPNLSPAATPLVAFAGVIFPAPAIAPLTLDLLHIKRRFKSQPQQHHLNYLLEEIKGSDLRKGVRSKSRRERRGKLGVLHETVRLLEQHHARIIGRVLIKRPDKGLDPDREYPLSVQIIARHFNHFLEANDSYGLILCDNRAHDDDVRVSHSVLTRKLKATGDELPRILESVVFARSRNHAGLQIADIVASGLLFPIAARTYCADWASSTHAHPKFEELQARYATRLKRLRYLYQDDAGISRGGITVSDKYRNQPSGLLLRQPEHSANTVGC